MKKSYSKPDIVFENFSLSTNVAATACAHAVQSFAEGHCGIMFGDRMVFLDGIAGCETKGAYIIEDGSPIANYLCYHVPTAPNALFHS